MQVMPETAARFGVPHPERSVEANLKAGSLYLRSLMRQFDGRLDLSLAAYNAGEGAVLGHSMAIPPYAETRRYVPAVISKYDEWRVPVTGVVAHRLPGRHATDAAALGAGAIERAERTMSSPFCPSLFARAESRFQNDNAPLTSHRLLLEGPWC